jgi:hypothetical protein
MVFSDRYNGIRLGRRLVWPGVSLVTIGHRQWRGRGRFDGAVSAPAALSRGMESSRTSLQHHSEN